MILVDRQFLTDLGIVSVVEGGRNKVDFFKGMEMTSETIRNFRRYYELATIDGLVYNNEADFYRAIGAFYGEPTVTDIVTFMRNATFDGVNPIGDFVTYYKGVAALLDVPTTPLEIFGSDLHTWINADTSPKTMTGSSINLIEDLSGNGNNMDDSAFGSPTLLNNELNGKSVINFDGAVQSLRSVKPTSEYTFMSDGTKFSVWCLAKITDYKPDAFFPILGTASFVSPNWSGYNFLYANRSSQGEKQLLDSDTWSGSGSTRICQNRSEINTFGSQSWCLISDKNDLSAALTEDRSHSKMNFYDERSANSLSGTPSASPPNARLQLAVNTFGAPKQFSKIQIAEMIIVKGDVTDEQENYLRSYFINEWGENTTPDFVSVLNIGDSINRGTSNGEGVAMANTLYEWTGVTVEEVQNEITRANPGSPYPSMGNRINSNESKPMHHLGFGAYGATFAVKNNGYPDWSSSGELYDPMKLSAKAYLGLVGEAKFDVIRITCGINDVSQSATLSEIETAMQDLIDRLNIDFPNTKIMINQMGNNIYDAGRYAAVRSYINDLVTNNSNVYAGTDLNSYGAGAFYDGVHLNQTYNNQLGVDDADLISGLL